MRREGVEARSWGLRRWKRRRCEKWFVWDCVERLLGGLLQGVAITLRMDASESGGTTGGEEGLPGIEDGDVGFVRQLLDLSGAGLDALQ